MIFIYDKNNHLKIVAKFHKKSLAIFYMTEGKSLISVEFFKEKNKNNARRVITTFEKDVKLWFSPLDRYEYSIRAISKESTRIEFPKQISRVESDFDGTPKLFTIQSDIIDRLISKL